MNSSNFLHRRTAGSAIWSVFSNGLPWPRGIAFLVFVLGLWIFSDWLLVWVGRSEVVSTPAVVLEQTGKQGWRFTVRDVHRIRFSEGGQEREQEVLLRRSLPIASVLDVEYFRDKPQTLYKANGNYQFSLAKGCYLGAAVLIAFLLIFSGGRRA